MESANADTKLPKSPLNITSMIKNATTIMANDSKSSADTIIKSKITVNITHNNAVTLKSILMPKRLIIPKMAPNNTRNSITAIVMYIKKLYTFPVNLIKRLKY
jgi:hypothetical protein